MSFGEQTANNVETTLNGAISAVATTFNVNPGDGALIPTIAAGTENYCRLTLDDEAGNIEIVYVTFHAAASDTIGTVVRAREGTTGFAFPDGSKVSMLFTAEAHDDKIGSTRFDVTGVQRNALGTSALDIQTTRASNTDVAAGTKSVAVGSNLRADNPYNVALGSEIDIRMDQDIAVGNNIAPTGASGNGRNVFVGQSLGDNQIPSYSIAIGNGNTISGARNIMLGKSQTHLGGSSGAANIMMGGYSQLYGPAQGNMLFGEYLGSFGHNHMRIFMDFAGGVPFIPFYGQAPFDAGIFVTGATPMVPKGDIGQPDRRRLSGPQMIVISPSTDLTSTGSFNITPNFPAPAGPPGDTAAFYIDEIGIILTTQPGTGVGPTVTTLPTVTFGFGGGGAQLLGATAVAGLAALLDRQAFAPLTLNGTRSLGWDITVAGSSAGQLWGRAYFRGWVTGDS